MPVAPLASTCVLSGLAGNVGGGAAGVTRCAYLMYRHMERVPSLCCGCRWVTTRAWVPLAQFQVLTGPVGWTCCTCCRLAPSRGERGARAQPLPGTEPRVGAGLPLRGLFFGPCRPPCALKPRTATAPASGHFPCAGRPPPPPQGAPPCCRTAGCRARRALPARPRGMRPWSSSRAGVCLIHIREGLQLSF